MALYDPQHSCSALNCLSVYYKGDWQREPLLSGNLLQVIRKCDSCGYKATLASISFFYFWKCVKFLKVCEAFHRNTCLYSSLANSKDSRKSHKKEIIDNHLCGLNNNHRKSQMCCWFIQTSAFHGARSEDIKMLSITQTTRVLDSGCIIKAEEIGVCKRISIELQFVSNCTELSC